MSNQRKCGSSYVKNSDFDTLETLGLGSFATVVLVRKQEGHDADKLFAMKMACKHNDKRIERGTTEYQILKSIGNTPFLLHVHYGFQSHYITYLITDYFYGGNLLSNMRIRPNGNFYLREVRFYIGEIVLALGHLHKLQIVHRDIKAGNIMLDNEGHIVLIDFGFAKQFPRHDPFRKTITDQEIGTVTYMAPEVLKRAYHGMPVDWWAVGILTHVLLAGRSPFDFNSIEECKEKIKTGIPSISNTLSRNSLSFVRMLLNKNPNKRLGNGGAIQLKQHKFFKSINWNIMAQKGYKPPIIPTNPHKLDISESDQIHSFINHRTSARNFVNFNQCFSVYL